MPKSNLSEEIAGIGKPTEGVPTVPPDAEAAMIQEALAKKPVKPRRKRTTRKVKQVFDASKATPPAGFRWAYNRLTIPYESMFDGMVYAFEPNEYRLLHADTAYFLWANAVIQYSPVTGLGLRAIALDPSIQMEAMESEGYGVPMDPPKNPELIDRRGIEHVRVPGGFITTPGLVSVTNPTGTTLPR